MWHLITDGSCLGNPGKGGWAFLLTDGHKQIIQSGYEEKTTNNRMELQALINGINYCMANCYTPIEVTMDSKYIINGVQDWMPNWKKKNWMNAAKKPVKNQDLWMKLDEIIDDSIKLNWTKGHNGHELHDKVDQIARCAANQHKNCKC